MATLSGMTGFGRTEGSSGDWQWAVETRSVNGRNLDVKFRGPGGFETLERTAKSQAQGLFHRGQIQIGLQATRTLSETPSARINEGVLSQYLAMANRLAEDGATPPSADGLLALRGVIEVAEPEYEPDARAAVEAEMSASVHQALETLKLSREIEGAQLLPVITDFVDTIDGLIVRAGTEASAQTGAIKDRFARRMAELAPDVTGLDERIVLEAAALATRADVREELDRLAAHVQSARDLITKPPAGRKLDFLMQEFMREANTLCSKSATTALTGIGLDLKAVIEQLREQIQNVE